MPQEKKPGREAPAVPAHVAIIMDGNRRWAKRRSLPAVAGHRAGVKSVYRIVRAARAAGVKTLTVYAFSTENWKRSKLEVSALMFLLKKTIAAYADELARENIRLSLCGRIDELPSSAREALRAAEARLRGNDGMTLNIALNYGGRQEIVDAANRALAAGAGKLDEKSFASYLYCPDLPDPDLVIRTSGEMRVSNFLLWQAAYSEFYVTETLWPDFGEAELEAAFEAYRARDRRRGA